MWPEPPVCRSASTAPSYPHLLLRRSPIATGLGEVDVGGWGEGKDETDEEDLRVNWIKVRESCAWSSTSLSRPGPSGSSGKTKSRRLEIRRDAGV